MLLVAIHLDGTESPAPFFAFVAGAAAGLYASEVSDTGETGV